MEPRHLMDVPHLSMADLEGELSRIHRVEHRTYTTALYGRGEPAELQVTVRGKVVDFRVRPVHCELDLRRALARCPGEEHLLLLVDFPADQLAADLHGRLASGRVWSADRATRIARLFKASEVSSELLACRPLWEAILADPRPFPVAILGTTVDLPTAWRALLSRLADLPTQGELSEERLLEHLVTRSVPGGAQALGPETAVGKELLRHLEKVAGPVAPVLWKAWLAGQGRRVAALTFVLDAGASRVKSDAGLRASLTAVLVGIDPALRDVPRQDAPLLERWGALADGLRRRLSNEPAHDLLAREILAEADALIPDSEVAATLHESRYLRAAFEAGLGALAEILREGASEISSPRAIQRAREHLDRLALHELGHTHGGAELVLRARMAVRLLAYLLSRPDLAEESAGMGSNGAVFALARHHVSDGGHVDLARDRARGPSDREIEKAIDAVLARVDALRERDDEAFATAYGSWLSSGSPQTPHVLPIARGLDHFAARFLKDQPHRRLLVLLLDGMSWANAVELLEDCEQKGHAPLRFRREEPLRPMLAAVPSLTGISRSSLFGGKPIRTGEVQATGRDPERFAIHPELRKAGVEDAVLYLKDSVEIASGDLGPKAIELVRSKERLVGVVVNALDDQLKGARQLRVPADLSHIKPLERLLREASDARRAVLLIADHGHVLTSRMESVGRAGDGRRYRFLDASEAAAPHEVVLSREHAWVAPGKARVALLYRDRDSYGTTPATGEHGGISIAEIVTPAILIGSEQLRRQVETFEGKDDAELEIAPLPRPDWWELQAPPAARSPRAEVPPAKPARPVKVAATMPLFDPPPPDEALAKAPPSESPWVARLRTTKAFDAHPASLRKRIREVLAERIAILAEAGGTLPSDVFARKVGVMPRNVGGVVSELQEVVGFDGYLIVEHDHVSRRVTLQVKMLEAHLAELS